MGVKLVWIVILPFNILKSWTVLFAVPVSTVSKEVAVQASLV